MISLAFIQGLLELLDMDCRICFDKESIPYPHFSENSSISAIFPEDNIVFIDKDAISSPMEFYIIISVNLYDLKLAKNNMSVMDRMLYSRAFADYIIMTVLEIEIEDDKSNDFAQIINLIRQQYPKELVHKAMKQFYDDNERINEMLDDLLTVDDTFNDFDIKSVA